MNVLIAGGTGMVGGLILEQCLSSTDVTSATSLVRKKTGQTHPKLKELVISDFSDFSKNKTAFADIDAALFCIGVYTGQVADDLFKKITVDYALAFAQALRQQSPNARLCLLSGAGADRSEKSKTAFARYKGMAENQIAKLGPHFHSFRPAYIYPVDIRTEPNMLYRIMRIMYPVIRLFGSNASIKSTELAQAMFEVALYGTDQEVLENRDILTLLSHKS